MTGRFSKTEGREFRDRCRAAIEGQTLDQQLFDAWVVTHDRRRLNIKKGTISSTRARILNAEATSYAALLAALPQQCRIEAKVAETSGDVKELLVQSTATLDMTTDIKNVLVGLPLQNGTPKERAAAASTSIAILALARKEAKADEKKDIAAAKKEAAAAAKGKVAAEIAAAKKAAALEKKKAAALGKKKATAAAKNAAAAEKKAAAAVKKAAAAQERDVRDAIEGVSRPGSKKRARLD